MRLTTSRFVVAMKLLWIVTALVVAAPRGAAEPRRFDPYAGPRPLLVWIQTDPWAMVLGADTPRAALYEDGTLICVANDGSGLPRHRFSKLSHDDLDRAVQRIQSFGTFSGLKRQYDIAFGVTDLPTARFYLDLGGGPPVVTEVYGLMARGTALPAWSTTDERRAPESLPASLAGLQRYLVGGTCEEGVPWIPEHVEIMLWPYEYAPQKSIQWPADWPGLDSPEATQRGDSYSIYLTGSKLDELRSFLKTRNEKGAVEVGGKKWAASYRYVFPSEPVWSKAFRQSLDAPVTESVEYYDVSGTTAAELRLSLNKSRPGGQKSPFGDGRTVWHVTWNYQYAKQDQCAITSVSITADIKTVLPRWSPAPGLPPNLGARWDAYMSALKVHEKGHADFGRDAARAVEQRLRELASFPDCPLLEAAVKDAGEGVIAEFSKKELGYDLRTAHGVTQGATFP